MKNGTPALDYLDQAAETYFSALKTGVKFQQDLAKTWTDMLNDRGVLGNVAGDIPKKLTELQAKIQEEADTSLKQLETNTHDTIEMLRKAFESGATPGTPEAQKKVQEFWESCWSMMKQQAEATAAANKRLMEAWTQLAETVQPKAQKATAGAK